MQLRTGLKPVRQLRWAVVSIGNLSTGGAGKTPLTIALANALTARGVHVDVLSRGYGRRRSTLPLLVERDGKAEDFGDEPLLIAREAQVPVYVADERHEAGLLAERASQPAAADQSTNQQLRLHLLDDGFQHRQLHRDVDILLLSRGDIQDHLLPAGNLREALSAAERADVIAMSADEPEVADWINAQGWQKMMWRLRRRMDVSRIDGPVVAFCGIARPEQFFAGLERAGLHVAARFAFRDHHRYAASDLDRVAAAARKISAATLVTTEKDRVRLGDLVPDLPLKAVPLRMEIEDEAAAVDWLLHRLAKE
jgi:tetraacyldisaccharide 4'-kinase